MQPFREPDLIDFGDVPEAVNDILQQAVALYRHDPGAAADRFGSALQFDPAALATYFCLYKIHTYGGRLDEALAVAEAGLAEAARQSGLSADWPSWTRKSIAGAAPRTLHFALYTLKAIAFIRLKRGETWAAETCLAKLAELGRLDQVGGSVIADLTRAVA